MKILVAIPCRNEEKYIEECVRAIFASKLDAGIALGVTVVDGLSDDGTIPIIESLQKEFSNLQLVSNEQQLTPFAFNLGIKSDPTADFYLVIGAHQYVPDTYLQTALNTLLENHEIDCVGGNAENIYLNETGRLISQAMSTSFGMGIGNFRLQTQSGFVDTVGTAMYRRAVFEKIGYFDEELVRNQDDEFNFRLRKAGGKIWLNAELSTKYYVRGSYQKLWRQFFQYGYWKVYVNKKHKAVTTLRQLAPPLFVGYLLSCILVGIAAPFIDWRIGVIWSAPLVCYFLINLFLSITLAKKAGDFVQLFRIFWILHLSYGLGYLQGIFHFVLLGNRPGQKQSRMSR